MINEQLQALAVPIDSVTPDPDNARSHGDANLAAVRHSLEKFGQQKAVVINRDRVIIAGNGTWAAAKALGWEEIAAVVYDGNGNERGFALADNRSAELARWDHEALAGQLKELDYEGFDLESLGWKDYELKPLLQSTWSPPGQTDETFEASEKQNESPIKFSAEQRQVIDRAIAALRNEVGDPSVKESRAIELICADYLAGTNQED